MKIIPRDNLPTFSLPLPIFSSIHIADAICQRGEEYDVFVGLGKEYVEQLKQLSLDESDVDLQNSTGDRNRFGVGSYEDWYKKGRTPFCLVHKQTDALAAVIWIGPKPLGIKSQKFGKDEKYKTQNEWHTISWRSYPVFRGRGMMKNFTKFVMDTYRMKFPNMKLWAGMDDRNTAMFKLSSELGFEADESSSDLANNWLVMVKGQYIPYHKSKMFGY
ncbi:MAG: hypothetical protein WCT44_02960 [Candidatus Paceibacterota bacterium]